MGNQNPYLTINYIPDNYSRDEKEHKQTFTFQPESNSIQIFKNHLPWITVHENTWVIQNSPDNLTDKDYQILYLLKKHYRKFHDYLKTKKGHHNSFQTITDLDLKRAKLQMTEEVSSSYLEHLRLEQLKTTKKKSSFGQE